MSNAQEYYQQQGQQPQYAPQPINQSMSPQPQYGQPQYGQPMSPQYNQPINQPMQGQPMMGQPMQAQPMMGQPINQPMYAQPAGPVLVSQAAGGLMANNGIPQAQVAMTAAGAVTVGMPAPQGVQCPPGLEYFAVLDHIWVKELPQLIDQLVDFNSNQKYQCINNSGQQVYWSAENTDVCTRQCCGSMRPFHIDVHDPTGKIAMKMDRPLRCNSIWCCCFPINCCCLQNMTVTDINGGLIGHVVQKTSFRPYFELVDASNKVLCIVKGPFMVNCCNCFSDVVFNIFLPTNKDQPVGTLTKKYGGVVRELVINNADNFAVVFPMDFSIAAKALLFASTFLIDFMFFEKEKPGSPSNR